jgi:hypothetical protein
MGGRRSRWLTVRLAIGALIIGSGCGEGVTEEGSDEPPGATATSASPATSVATVPTTASTPVPTTGQSVRRFDAVTVASGQTMEPPYPWWWVLDLSSGTTIEGSGRVLVEVPQGEVGCGEAQRPIGAFQIEPGETVSFERVEGPPGQRPGFWMPPEVEVSTAVPAVRARQFRVACPEGTEGAAAELAAQRATWERVGPASYEFSMSWHVFNDTAGDYRIAVVDRRPVAILRSDGTHFDPSRVAGNLPTTIDELFDAFEREVSGDSFVATYDPALGYPTSVEVDEMRDAVDDELGVAVHSLTPGTASIPAGNPAQIGQRIDATTVDAYPQSPDGVTLWLLVDASAGIVVDGSSRLAVQVPIDEVRCGPELRPVETLESLAGGAVSFELVAIGAAAPPAQSPMWSSGPTVTARDLRIPTCPATTG